MGKRDHFLCCYVSMNQGAIDGGYQPIYHLAAEWPMYFNRDHVGCEKSDITRCFIFFLLILMALNTSG